jgi:hypothetical protein
MARLGKSIAKQLEGKAGEKVAPSWGAVGAPVIVTVEKSDAYEKPSPSWTVGRV